MAVEKTELLASLQHWNIGKVIMQENIKFRPSEMFVFLKYISGLSFHLYIKFLCL